MPVNPTQEQLAEVGAIAGSADDRPVIMLNLNTYRERAAYDGDPPGGLSADVSGRQAYERYGEVAQRVLTRDQLLDLSRLHNAEVYDRSIDVQILRLRRKIEVDPAHPKFIVTERGAGYVFASDVTPVR